MSLRTCLEQIYSLVIPLSQTISVCSGKNFWAEIPIFLDVEQTVDGVRVCRTKSLQYLKYLHDWVGLGRTCGFKKKLESMNYGKPQGSNLLVRVSTYLKHTKLAC